jgi:hypothetical protein
VLYIDFLLRRRLKPTDCLIADCGLRVEHCCDAAKSAFRLPQSSDFIIGDLGPVRLVQALGQILL